MPVWNEELQQWGYLYYEEAPNFEWWGIDRRTFMPKYENGQNVERINNNFVYHKPKDDQPERYEHIRAKARELALVINECTPMSREQSLAFTDLEDCVMHANAAIARNE